MPTTTAADEVEWCWMMHKIMVEFEQLWAYVRAARQTRQYLMDRSIRQMMESANQATSDTAQGKLAA